MHRHGLVQHFLPVTNATLGTLGARTAIALNTVMTSITNAFLLLRVKYLLQISGRTAPDNGPIIAGLAPGDSELSEIDSGLQEANTAGPRDVTQSLTEDARMALYMSSIRPFKPVTDSESYLHTGWISLAKRGIPAHEDQGFQCFAFNTGGGALTTGQSVDGGVWVQGVWLND